MSRTDPDGVRRTYRSGDTFEATASEVSSYADKVKDCGPVVLTDCVAEPLRTFCRGDGYWVGTSSWMLNDVPLSREEAESLL